MIDIQHIRQNLESTAPQGHPKHAKNNSDNALAHIVFPHQNHRDTSASQNGKNRWMLPYADLMTLLLGLFLVLFATQYKQLHQPSEASSPFKEMNLEGLFTNLDTLAPTTEANSSDDSIQWAFDEQHVAAKIQTIGNKTTVSFDEKLFFEPGQAQLTPAAKKTLGQIAHVLKPETIAPNHLRIEGHTDNTPIHTSQFPSNWELSTMRATVILRELIQAHHFNPQIISAAGYGEFSPVAENTNDAGRRQNRRVDFVIERAEATTAAPNLISEKQPEHAKGELDYATSH